MSGDCFSLGLLGKDSVWEFSCLTRAVVGNILFCNVLVSQVTAVVDTRVCRGIQVLVMSVFAQEFPQKQGIYRLEVKKDRKDGLLCLKKVVGPGKKQQIMQLALTSEIAKNFMVKMLGKVAHNELSEEDALFEKQVFLKDHCLLQIKTCV